MEFIFEILKSVIYGVIQGITEWLPISSTGHLILLNTVLPLNVFNDAAKNIAFWDMYKVVIQFGSILAVALIYFEKLNPFSAKKNKIEKQSTWNLWIKIIVATIPAGIAGVLLDDFIDAKFSTPVVVAVALIVYGVLFIIMKNVGKTKVTSVKDMDYLTAFKIGCFQMLALIPGTSRSGSTILGSTLVGCSRTTATEFSFFMAIPVMLGASILKLIKMQAPFTLAAAVILLVGMFVAFIVSVIVIRSFLKYIRKHDFKVFGIYRIILGILILILALTKLLPTGLVA